MILLEVVANLMVALSVDSIDYKLKGWHQQVFLIVAPILLCCFLVFFTMNILNFRFFIQRKVRQAKMAGVKITTR
jgi:peptidoglycan biosynthesis protein MviN/MurJ (putative lipid II flippase)